MSKRKINSSVEKIFDILKSTHFYNIMHRTWIDVVLSLNSNSDNTFKKLEKNQKKWVGPVFGHKIEWLKDFIKDSNFTDELTQFSIYLSIYTKTDSLISRIFDVDFSLSQDKNVQEFLHFAYYEARDDEWRKFRKKNVRFGETIFKYNYLLKTPDILYDYQPLKDRIDLSKKDFKDSYEKEEFYDKLLPDLYLMAELPNVAENFYKILNKEQNKHMGLSYNWGSFNLKDEIEFFNGIGRKLRNEIVHTEMGEHQPLGFSFEELQQFYITSEHIEFCIIINLMFNVFPDSIFLLDLDFENIDKLFK